MALRVGLRLPRDGAGSKPVRATALAAEELGFDSLWCEAHLAIPADIGERYPLAALGRPSFGPTTPFPDPFTSLAYAAALTRRVRLGTSVIPLLASHPLLLARSAASLDVLSDGRLELGLGAGWLAEEAALLGQPADHPSGRLAEAVRLLRAAWAQGTFEWQGRYFRVPSVGIYPRPPQGADLPVWIGGYGPRAEQVAAELGAGLLLSRTSPEAVAERRARRPGLRVGLTLAVSGPADAWVESVCAFQAAGAELVVLLAPFDDGRLIDRLHAFARSGASLLAERT